MSKRKIFAIFLMSSPVGVVIGSFLVLRSESLMAVFGTFVCAVPLIALFVTGLMLYTAKD